MCNATALNLVDYDLLEFLFNETDTANTTLLSANATLDNVTSSEALSSFPTPSPSWMNGTIAPTVDLNPAGGVYDDGTAVTLNPKCHIKDGSPSLGV